MPTTPALFVLNVVTRGISADVRVNDVTVYTNRGKQATFAEKINPLVVAGPNTVTVLLAQPLPDPTATNNDQQVQRKFRLTVQGGVLGADPGDAGIILRYRWESARPLTLLMSEVFRESFDAGTVTWQPRWLDFPQVRTSDRELQDFVIQFVDSLRSGDIERLLALHAPKFRGLAETLDLDEGQIKEAFRNRLRNLMSATNWSVDGVNVNQLRSRAEANGRVVRVTLENGEPPIMTHGPAGDVPFSINLSRIDGELRIVR